MASRSPTAATPLPKSSVAPESPSKHATEQPQPVPFPSPQTFEIIPPLHGILLRLLSQKSSPGGNAGVSGEAPGVLGASEAHQQDQVPSNGNAGATSQAVPDVPTLNHNAHPPLDVKDLPTQTSSVRIRIQKARVVVEALPDIHRSVEEQQREITELEDRVARLRSVITDFGSRAAKT
ncbi:hypothetical protein N7466_009118 [Penicillium verhagenii]|uniref:uncharacterized protein n=1 Tax=Penicillium verhagenii TaxID=1562060 RepID=UPI002544FF03|nr:uncharacterized protein N7466_009118 [Penicillium verhagenii]KAJ5920792.1 hypothetical protein N7466_009118 [Penicillium verhagenii]